jgi:hypothetical protein
MSSPFLAPRDQLAGHWHCPLSLDLADASIVTSGARDDGRHAHHELIHILRCTKICVEQ